MLAGLTLVVALGVWFARDWRGTRPSLLLVTIDTLRADHVGAYGYGQSTTPALDALAARGARFAHVQSAAPLTGPSHATILTGQYPPLHGVRDNARFTIAARARTLAERLRDAGYETAAFVGAYPVAGAFGFARGFSLFDEGLRPGASAGSVAERPGERGGRRRGALAGSARARPFFAWVHLFDPHEPYAPPAAYRERFTSPYDGEIAFADAQLGRLVDVLRAAGRLERTLIAVAGRPRRGARASTASRRTGCCSTSRPCASRW